jgi:hypothetical protein
LKPKKLTIAEVAKLARDHGAGDAWDKLTAAGRKQWADRVNQERAEQHKLEQEEEARARRAADAFDRFMAPFLAPVRKEQRAAARKAKKR